MFSAFAAGLTTLLWLMAAVAAAIFVVGVFLFVALWKGV